MILKLRRIKCVLSLKSRKKNLLFRSPPSLDLIYREKNILFCYYIIYVKLNLKKNRVIYERNSNSSYLIQLVRDKIGFSMSAACPMHLMEEMIDSKIGWSTSNIIVYHARPFYSIISFLGVVVVCLLTAWCLRARQKLFEGLRGLRNSYICLQLHIFRSIEA